MSNLVPIVAYLADLVDTIVCQYSYILQKQGLHRNEAKKRQGINENILCNSRWIIGFVLLLITSIIHMLLLPFADLVLLLCNSGFAILFSNIMSICILKEKAVIKYDLPATIMLTAACLMIN